MKQCSTSPIGSGWWKSCLSPVSLYLAILVILAPNHLDPHRLLCHEPHLTDKWSSTSGLSSTSNSNSMLVGAAVAVQSGDCIPLGALIANRFNRSPMNSLRMLRGDGDIRDMEHLIRTHHNCLLKADRIRFKKASPSWPYKAKPSQLLAKQTSRQVSDSDESVEQNERDKELAGRYLKLAALIGWHRAGGNKPQQQQQQQHRLPQQIEWPQSGYFPVRLTLLPNYQNKRTAEKINQADSEEIEQE